MSAKERAEEVIRQFLSSSHSENQAKLYGGLEQASENWSRMETSDPEFLIGLIAEALQRERREALIECWEIASNFDCSKHDYLCGLEIANAIRKLAEEK